LSRSNATASAGTNRECPNPERPNPEATSHRIVPRQGPDPHGACDSVFGLRPRPSLAAHLQRPHGRHLDFDEGRHSPGSQVVHAGGRAKAGEKFPALLEYHPYRKDDGTAARDYPLYSYFAHRGYVCARVDIRGFGNSEGVPTDREYSEQEQLDGLQIISWLAHQSWSNGNVGMMGISWSGFNSLQMAMRHPPELKAILAVAATAELFHDDVHYMDGMAHLDEFELNMDLAPGITGAPDFTLDDKILGPRFDAALVPSLFQTPA
jgi:alpha/beta superfamily hydrolase